MAFLGISIGYLKNPTPVNSKNLISPDSIPCKGVALTTHQPWHVFRDIVLHELIVLTIVYSNVG
jgi:hypothetical protein